MSRIGKKPITIPDKTTLTYKDRLLTVKGQKGTLSRSIHDAVDLDIKDSIVNVTISVESKSNRALQGLTRSLIANMISGVNSGFDTPTGGRRPRSKQLFVCEDRPCRFQLRRLPGLSAD